MVLKWHDFGHVLAASRADTVPANIVYWGCATFVAASSLGAALTLGAFP